MGESRQSVAQGERPSIVLPRTQRDSDNRRGVAMSVGSHSYAGRRPHTKSGVWSTWAAMARLPPKLLVHGGGWALNGTSERR
jgi:hypothetical protein